MKICAHSERYRNLMAAIFQFQTFWGASSRFQCHRSQQLGRLDPRRKGGVVHASNRYMSSSRSSSSSPTVFELLCRIGVLIEQIPPRKHVPDDADSMAMAPSRQHELVTAVDNTRSGTDLAKIPT